MFGSTFFKLFSNIVLTSFFTGGLSFFSMEFCNWYGCNSWTTIFRSDMICNSCTDVSYHLKNYQTSMYGSLFTVISCQMTDLVTRAGSSKNLIFQ